MIFLVLIYVLLGVLVLLFLCEMWRQLYKLNTVNNLIRTYEHDVENPKSGRVMQKVGMTFEGVARKGGRNNRGIIDEARYAILRSDFA